MYVIQMPLSDNEGKRLEYEFHSAGYHLLLEMITGLRTVMSHLVREVRTYVHVHVCVFGFIHM